MIMRTVVIAIAFTLCSMPLTANAQWKMDFNTSRGKLERQADEHDATKAPIKRIKRASPVYPGEGQGITGVVTLRVTVDRAGKVGETRAVRFISTAGDPPKDAKAQIAHLFVKSAVEALSSWQFEMPGRRPITYLISVVASPTASAADADGEGLQVQNKRMMTVPHTHSAYPPLARSQQIQGVIVIEATVTPAGRVLDARVLRAIPWLDQAALDIVALSEFESPATAQGSQPRNSIVDVWLNFVIPR